MRSPLSRPGPCLGFGSWVALSVGVLCCAPDRTETLNRDSNLGLTASIRDLMDAEIDPAADFLWASVASVSSEAGLEDRQPRTTDDWAEARRKAITLVEATNLLVMSGRRVSTAYVPARGLGELDSTEVQKRIDAAPGAFKALAQVLRESSLKALTAIDARNPAELLEAGGAIDAACEACHVTFWYPEQPVTRHKR